MTEDCAERISALNDEGADLIDASEPQRALEVLDNARKLISSIGACVECRVRLHHNIGVALEDLKRPADALWHYRAALMIRDDEDTEFNYNRLAHKNWVRPHRGTQGEFEERVTKRRAEDAAKAAVAKAENQAQIEALQAQATKTPPRTYVTPCGHTMPLRPGQHWESFRRMPEDLDALRPMCPDCAVQEKKSG